MTDYKLNVVLLTFKTVLATEFLAVSPIRGYFSRYIHGIFNLTLSLHNGSEQQQV